MANMYINAMTDLWNSGGTLYNAIKMNVTNAASLGGSKLLNLQVGGSEKLTVDATGAVVAASTITSAGMVSSGAPLPSADDAAALGASGTAWSDLFLASGATLNFAASNVVATHSSGVLTVSTGDLRMGTAGTNAASVATVGGTQTLTNKTLTSPTINNATVTGSAINSSPIGASSASTGAFTSLTATSATLTGTISLGSALFSTTNTSGITLSGGSSFSAGANIELYGGAHPSFPSNAYYDANQHQFRSQNGGAAFLTVSSGLATFHNAITVNGEFYTSNSVTAAGNLSIAGGYVVGSGPHLVLGTNGAQAGVVYLRPNGVSSGAGQTTVDSAGTMAVGGNLTAGHITASGNIAAAGTVTSGQVFASSSGNAILAASGGATYFRPNGAGSGAGEIYVDGLGNIVLQSASAAATGGVYAGRGIRGKFGFNGGYGANWHNFAYAAPFTYLYVDSTNFGAISTSSDYRIKKEVTGLPSKWDTVKALRPISYTHTDYGDLIQSDEIERWGFIAHELQETLIPSAATGTKDEENLIQSPNPWTVLAALTSALQEAMTRIEALEEAANG